MEILNLIIPRLNMKESFMGMVNDYIINNEILDHRPYFKEDFIFEDYIKHLETRRNLPISSIDPIKQYEWWLVNNNNIIGTTRLRMALETDVEINEEGNIGYDIAPSFRKKRFWRVDTQINSEKSKRLWF